MYLGASLCFYIFFLAHDVFFVFDWAFHDRGRYIDLYMFLVSHCLLIYIYELFMIYVFIVCYVKSRSYFCLLVFFTHAFMCLLSVSGNIQVDPVVLLSTLATDR